MTDGGGPGPAAGEGDAGQLEGAHDQILEPGMSVDALAEIEPQTAPPYPGEPAEITVPDRQELHFVAPPPEHIAHLVDVGHHRGHVLGTPLFAAGIEEDRDFHQATSARSERPLIRRQATSATARIRSS